MPTDEEKARIDRELMELLNEIRVALPGVQVLFAFLLILPFQQRFDQTSDIDRAVYTLALLSSATAAALLIAPSAYHRLNFRRRNKERMLFDANRLLLAGMLATGVGYRVRDLRRDRHRLWRDGRHRRDARDPRRVRVVVARAATPAPQRTGRLTVP